jgi:hypothetical protein
VKDKKWTIKETEIHLETNSKDTYSMAVVLAALYKKLYGELPKIGLSGFQAEAALVVYYKLPNKKVKNEEK